MIFQRLINCIAIVWKGPYVAGDSRTFTTMAAKANLGWVFEGNNEEGVTRSANTTTVILKKPEGFIFRKS